MKKLYYLLALIAVVFTSCDPLSQTYKTLDALPKATVLATYTTTLGPYKSASDANANVPAALATKYPNATNGSNAIVTFGLVPSSSNVAAPDTTLARIAFTLVATDYTFPASTLPNGTPVPGNSAANLTSTTAINYLNYKYPTPVANQLVVLTYNYLETGNTPPAGATVTDSFIYLASGWTKAYTLTATQYTAAGRGANGYFSATDYALLPGIFTALLNSDPIVMGTAKAGTVVYVSYKFTTAYQKILTLTYDGNNWSEKQTLPYLKLSGVWVPDPTIYLTELATTNYGNPDYQYLNTLTTIGNTANRDNVAHYGDFNIQSTSTYYWPDADIATALGAILLHKIANPIIGVPYRITYYVYNGTTLAAVKTLVYNGTAFVQQ